MKIEYHNKKLSRRPYIVHDDKSAFSPDITLIINEHRDKITLEIQNNDGSRKPLPPRFSIKLRLQVPGGKSTNCNLFWDKNSPTGHHLFVQSEKSNDIKMFSLPKARENATKLVQETPQLTSVWEDVAEHHKKSLTDIAREIESAIKEGLIQFFSLQPKSSKKLVSQPLQRQNYPVESIFSHTPHIQKDQSITNVRKKNTK